MIYFMLLEKGRRPFKVGTKRRYGNYVQLRTESGWREYPIDDAIADRDIERVTEPGSSYSGQSHPPKRMHPHPESQKRKLHAFASEVGQKSPHRKTYKKKPKVKKKTK